MIHLYFGCPFYDEMYSSLTPIKRKKDQTPIMDTSRPETFVSSSPFLREHSVFYILSKKSRQDDTSQPETLHKRSRDVLGGGEANSPFPSTMISSPALLVNTAPLYHHNKQLGQAQYEVGRLKQELDQTKLEAEHAKIAAEGKISKLETLCKAQQEKLDILEGDLRMLFESETALKKEIEDISKGKNKQVHGLNDSIKELQQKNKDLNETKEVDKKKTLKLKRLLEETQHELTTVNKTFEGERKLLQDQVGQRTIIPSILGCIFGNEIKGTT